MQQTEYSGIIERGRRLFASGATLSFDYRWQALDGLHTIITRREQDIAAALAADLGKSEAEAYLTETGQVLAELSLCREKLAAWMKPRRVPSPLSLFPAKSRIYPEPFGLALIMAPWNYPFHLCMIPLVNALAAGNCAVLKPSSKAPATGKIMAEIIEEACQPGHVSVILGDGAVGETLLQERFDFIFYTGSTRVGREVMAAAARHLTPVCLELGGKSPVIVAKDADLALAAKRIAWGKVTNAGQTCVAPDYVLVEENAKDRLVALLEREFARFPGPNATHNQDYCRIISPQALERLASLAGSRARFDRATMRMAPLVMPDVRPDDTIMQGEIFGPLLPVLGVPSLDAALEFVRNREKPLACYVFGKEKTAETVLTRLSFGGGCVNDTLMHVGSPYLPFGGVGNSGMGRYHGQAGFDLFSNMKGVVHQGAWPDPALRYPPYSGGVMDLLRRLLR